MKKIRAIYKYAIISIYIGILLNVCVYANEPKQQFTVLYDPTSEPIQYTGVDQRANGITIDILRQLEDAPNSKIDFVFYPMTPGLDIQSFDLNVSKINQPASEYMRRSRPYYNLSLSLFGPIMTKDTPTFDASAPYKIGTLAFNNITNLSIRKYLNNSKVVFFDTYSKLHSALDNGEIDYILTNTFSTQSDLLQEELQLYPLEITLPLQFFISDNAPVNAEVLLNEAILELGDHDVTNIIFNNDYFIHDTLGYMDQTTSYDFIDMVKIVSASVGGALVLLLLCFVGYKMHIEKIAFTDNLTGFYTTIKFNLNVTKILKTAQSNQYSLICIDIDKFQLINELCSFATGTIVIKRLAQYIEEFYPNAIYICRNYADSFMLLLENDGSEIQLSKYPDMDFSNIEGLNFPVNISQGVFVIHNPEEELTTMIGAVNQACALAKKEYGHTMIVHEEKMDMAYKSQNRIISKMDMALKEREFDVYYQPKVSFADRKICGAEALVRWKPKDGSMIFPDEFIPLFESNRYITKLDAYVFDATCAFIAENRERLEGIVISINLSTVSLMQDDLASSLLNTINHYQIPITSVELEITESAFVENVESMLKKVEELRTAGFTLSLDDFGSGISSLNQLQNLDIDIMKIDKNFLQDSLNEKKGVLIIENIIELGKKLNLKMVAEGVETIEGVNLLTNLGCDIAQGYYFSKPLPEEQFLTFVDTYIPDI